ncbi:MAG: DHA2 family efflux MFS transporter permease subunit [Alicyclobacillus macrosporangiidus]|uniref:DHA2 family efflux MFS transporter permease subunit n=1 Tax=Alicyclobacillus macrosporangiidus TaxID=392015 RepID=UPI0026ED0EB5|nr:DHA2 family efflux MFS transporter permease subunit [Alicyclobacillus macrosporangiidus]MCL6600060.1 DHA2 family efflux MFS transporter permease subunit [Alicyclobacillus macrosporangiidus]
MQYQRKTDDIQRVDRPYLQLFIILLGTFMAVLDNSIVNVAIPTMETALNANTDSIKWVVTGYMLISGVVVPVSGWLSDRLGPKHLFLFSLVSFTLGSALCGAAWNLPSMIAFRLLQGLGGGFMMPVANAMIFRIFPPEKRGVVMGLFGLAIMAAPAFGPLLSGYFVEDASWRLIFYINVPIGVIGTLLGVLFLYEFPHQVTSKLDVLGITLSTVGLFSLLFGFNNVAQYGWGSPHVWPFVVVGALVVFFFILVELFTENPVIELRVFRYYLYTMSTLISSVLQVALFVGLFVLPLYLQNIMGYTAIRTGLFMTPAALVSAVGMVISGRLLNKVGARTLGIIGLTILTVTTYGFTKLDMDSTSTSIQVLYIFRSLGMSLTMMPMMTVGMNQVPLRFVAQASAVGNTFRQVMASLGTAVFLSYMGTQTNLHLYHMDAQMTPYSPQGLQLRGLEAGLEQAGVSPFAAHRLALGLVYNLLSARSFVEGMNDLFMVSTLLTLVALVMTLFFRSRREAPQQAAQPSVVME